MVTIAELLASSYAKKYDIKNVPSQMDVWRNLCDLLAVMNAVRAEYSAPITVTSGYRCPELNVCVGGAKNSAHQYGLAVDIKVSEKNIDNYLSIQKSFIKFAKKLGYNSIVIHEYPQSGVPSWLHLELSKTKPSKIFTIQ